MTTNESNHKHKLIFLFAALLLILLLFVAFLYFNSNPNNKSELTGEAENYIETIEDEKVSDNMAAATAEFLSVSPESAPEPTPEPTPEPFEEYDISLMALGDNLMHMGIVNTGRNADKTYNYDFLFQNMTDFLSAADLKIINQETILGGNKFGFSGFPYFNSPTEVGDAIAAAGFNVVLHATNHAADKEIAGLKNCVEFWESHPEVLMVGINSTDNTENGSYFDASLTDEYEIENDAGIPVIKIKDFTFAVLNYTYSPNSETIPSSIMGHLNILCDYNENTGRLNMTKLNENVIEDIKKADELADIVLVFPHWGNEYQKKPSVYQQTFALQMAEAGADVIIGAHPHVPQPIEWITAENGNTALCYYSLGNYVSTQKEALCMLEEMAWVTFHVTEEGISVTADKSGAIPIVCHYTSGPVRLENVYLLEEYTEEKALSHGIKGYGGVTLHLDTLQTYADEIFGDFILKKADVLHTDLVND